MEIQNMFRRHQEDITNLQKTIEGKLKTLREKGLELERLRSLNLKSSMQAEARIKVSYSCLSLIPISEVPTTKKETNQVRHQTARNKSQPQKAAFS